MFGKLEVQAYANALACLKTADANLSSNAFCVWKLDCYSAADFSIPSLDVKEFEEYQWEAAKSGAVTIQTSAF